MGQTKSYDFSVTRVPGEGFCGTEQVFEDILTGNFPNLASDINLHIQKILWNLKQGKPKENNALENHHQIAQNINKSQRKKLSFI